MKQLRYNRDKHNWVYGDVWWRIMKKQQIHMANYRNKDGKLEIIKENPFKLEKEIQTLTRRI